jgi:tRNA dimethylallyltransferase
MPARKKTIILIAGPTGVGKTALSLRLADRLRTEIISADSLQVYRYLDIGTAKPDQNEQSRVRHHLIDVVEPDEPFDAARYLEFAAPVIDRLHRQQMVPLVVGGTGLYIKVLTRGICQIAPVDPRVREQLLEEERTLGAPALHRELSRVDPSLAAKIHPNDRQRTMRALEVYRTTKVPLSQGQKQHRFSDFQYSAVKVFLYRQREELYERINLRVHRMMEQGFLEEIQGLLNRGYGSELKPLQSLGYKQLIQHLRGELTLQAAIAAIQRETRRYAKRQMTWFRGDPDFQWLLAEEEEKVIDYIVSAIR